VVVNYNVQNYWHEKAGRYLRAELKTFLLTGSHFEVLCSDLWTFVEQN
jgi:hypothetical protein